MKMGCGSWVSSWSSIYNDVSCDELVFDNLLFTFEYVVAVDYYVNIHVYKICSIPAIDYSSYGRW